MLFGKHGQAARLLAVAAPQKVANQHRWLWEMQQWLDSQFMLATWTMLTIAAHLAKDN